MSVCVFCRPPSLKLSSRGAGMGVCCPDDVVNTCGPCACSSSFFVNTGDLHAGLSRPLYPTKQLFTFSHFTNLLQKLLSPHYCSFWGMVQLWMPCSVLNLKMNFKFSISKRFPSDSQLSVLQRKFSKQVWKVFFSTVSHMEKAVKGQ